MSPGAVLKTDMDMISVPDSKSRNIPEVVVVWRWAVGVGVLEGVG
jgi:hypothetical protein